MSVFKKLPTVFVCLVLFIVIYTSNLDVLKLLLVSRQAILVSSFALNWMFILLELAGSFITVRNYLKIVTF